MSNAKVNKKIFDFAYHFSEIAKKEKWVPRYDIESDSFSLTVPKLPDDARIKYFDDEVAFYITKDNNIKGIFIEYFRSNFVEHHKDFKNLLKGIKKDRRKLEKSLVELKKSEIKKRVSEFEEIIQESLLENIEFRPVM